MDPDVILAEIRLLYMKILMRKKIDDDTEELARKVKALDQWLSNGNLPKPWR
jgi:hypothetical protein